MGTYGLDALSALGDPTRRAIFELLTARPSAVGELAQRLPVSRPAVSQHLKVLKEAGLVVDDAIGTRRLYRVNPDGIAALRAYLDRTWDTALAAYAEAVERTALTDPTDPDPTDPDPTDPDPTGPDPTGPDSTGPDSTDEETS